MTSYRAWIYSRLWFLNKERLFGFGKMMAVKRRKLPLGTIRELHKYNLLPVFYEPGEFQQIREDKDFKGVSCGWEQWKVNPVLIIATKYNEAPELDYFIEMLHADENLAVLSMVHRDGSESDKRGNSPLGSHLRRKAQTKSMVKQAKWSIYEDEDYGQCGHLEQSGLLEHEGLKGQSCVFCVVTGIKWNTKIFTTVLHHAAGARLPKRQKHSYLSWFRFVKG